MKIFVNASNIHVGGGKVLLNDLIGVIHKFIDIKFIVFVDKRFKLPLKYGENIVFNKVTKIMRWRVANMIEHNANKDDIAIYFTNIPPMIKHKCKTILVQSNRFIIDRINLFELPFKTSIRIIFERLLFWSNNKNIDYIVVQSESMHSILVNSRVNKNKVKVIAYRNKDEKNNIVKCSDEKAASKKDFIYIASDDPHKNHKNLVEAWCLLSKIGIYPKLTLTIDQNTHLHQFVMKKVREYRLNVEILPNLEREKIIDLYIQSKALIFPSLFESYGLPLVEAHQYGIPVIASELDYVRDVVEPVETFDPNSAKSISRSVKRFLKIEEKKTEIITPVDFINNLINL